MNRQWDSFGDFIDEVGSNRPICHNKSMQYGNRMYFGTDSFDEALGIARTGWPAGLEHFQRITSNLWRRIEGAKEERHQTLFSECGDEVDIDRFISGEPECMVEYELVHVPVSGRIVKLVCNLGASSAIGTDQFFLRGAASLALADLIERSGLRCEIWIGNAIMNNGIQSEFSVKIKAADQPCELDRLIFMIAHPSTLRRLFFHVYAQLPAREFNQFIGVGYGTPRQFRIKGDDVIHTEPLQYGFGNNLTNKTVPAFVNKMLTSFLET